MYVYSIMYIEITLTHRGIGMQRIQQTGWIVTRNDDKTYTYSKVDKRMMCTIVDAKQYGYLLTITIFKTNYVRKIYNLCSVDKAKDLYDAI